MQKQVTLIALCVALAVAVPTAMTRHSMPGMSAAFDAWKGFHGKEYATEDENIRRLQIFTENAIRVEEHNAQNLSWRMALTQFADLTADEFAAQQKLIPSTLGTDSSPAAQRHIDSKTTLPTSVDWRTKGLVTPVKNQGSCGSCWAFSTVVSLEGQSAKLNGTLTSYSEQDLVDCVKGQTIPGQSDQCCDGCQGGLMDYAFEYMIGKQGGKDDTEASYPYTAKNGKCSFNPANTGEAVVKSYTDIAAGDEASLKDAVANVGPVSVAVDANTFWQLYGGGVFKPFSCNQNKLNHGVAVVGYGSDKGSDYWIIKNSWGATWGEQGYMRMIYGKNECGVANAAVYPVL